MPRHRDEGKGYDELLQSTKELTIGKDITVRVLELATLIEVKRRAGRPKNLAALPILEATLDELRRGSVPP